MADLRLVYIGPRSIRAGMIWLVLMGLAFVDGVDTVIVLEESVGVVRLTAGRDRSAGLMSGILEVYGPLRSQLVVLCENAGACSPPLREAEQAASRAEKMPTATRKGQSFGHATIAQDYAIMTLGSN